MKKIILLVVSLVFVASLFAGASGEAYMDYPLIGYAGAADEDGGLVSGYVGIGYWGADYGFHFNFRDTAYPGDNFTINHMFKKFTLHKYVNLLVGKTAVPLVKENNPSGFANTNIIEGHCWDFVNPQNEFMIKLDGNIKGVGWQIYTANINASTNELYYYAMNGLRLDYNLMGADIGVGIQMDDNVRYPWGEFTGEKAVDSKMNWAFDLGYTVAEMVNFKLQLVNYDDADDDTDDMQYYTILEYVPGFKGIKPYFGYYVESDMRYITTIDEIELDVDVNEDGLIENWDVYANPEAEQQNLMFFGLNMNPTENSILKLEYKMDSLEYLIDGDDLYADTLTLQLGFSF